ncbi:MAG: hypothetical protein ABII06_13295 [Pseudomonadota bacterium]
MLKSIKETQMLLKVEGMEDGKVHIEASKYLLSLPEKMQSRVLSDQLKNLKQDLARLYETPEGRKEENDVMDRTQLQLLIQVIEGLLARI